MLLWGRSHGSIQGKKRERKEETCGPIFDEAQGQTLLSGPLGLPQRHLTEAGRSATIRAAGTFTPLLYHL
jgi:hypothetical protein